MTAEERARSFLPGPAWDGKGAGNVIEADATAFSEFPLFWLGTEFGGYSLHSIHRSKYDVPNAHPEDLWRFVYGDCPKKPNEGCMLPVSVQIRPVCLVRPEMIGPEVKAGSLERVGASAALMQSFSEDFFVMIWTDEVSIRVSVPADARLLDRAIAELKGMGTAAGIDTADLGAPDFGSCS